MHGDLLFCTGCDHLFYDINVVYDTRRWWFVDRCPWCLGFFTLNVWCVFHQRKFSHGGLRGRVLDACVSQGIPVGCVKKG